VLEAVTAALARRFPVVAAVTAHGVAGLWLAPAAPVLGFNTSMLSAGVIMPS
jgi:hypothetical protein